VLFEGLVIHSSVRSSSGCETNSGKRNERRSFATQGGLWEAGLYCYNKKEEAFGSTTKQAKVWVRLIAKKSLW
jgi:hypothetical protein